jgi:hypothetical protein
LDVLFALTKCLSDALSIQSIHMSLTANCLLLELITTPNTNDSLWEQTHAYYADHSLCLTVSTLITSIFLLFHSLIMFVNDSAVFT